jgi:glycerol uptake facilitator-like aquaporin
MVVVDQNNLNIPMILQPFLLAFVIATHGLAFGYNCGPVLNPARDFGPRLFTAIAGWGLAVFKYLITILIHKISKIFKIFIQS